MYLIHVVLQMVLASYVKSKVCPLSERRDLWCGVHELQTLLLSDGRLGSFGPNQSGGAGELKITNKDFDPTIKSVNS
jgi:hypothetical protein